MTHEGVVFFTDGMSVLQIPIKRELAADGSPVGMAHDAAVKNRVACIYSEIYIHKFSNGRCSAGCV